MADSAHAPALDSREGTAISGYRVRLAHRPDADSWQLEPGRHLVGRASECRICIDDCTVSRQHVEIEVFRSGGLMLRDLGSTNGCLINGKHFECMALSGYFDLRVGGVLLEFDPIRL